jgi:hypothetical protein
MLCYSDFRLSKYVLPCQEGSLGAGSLAMKVQDNNKLQKEGGRSFS